MRWIGALLLVVGTVVTTLWVAVLSAEMQIWYSPQVDGDPDGYLVAVLDRLHAVVLGAALLCALLVLMRRRGASAVEVATFVVIAQLSALAALATVNESGDTGRLAVLTVVLLVALAALWVGGLIGAGAGVLAIGVLAANALGRLLDDDSTDQLSHLPILVLCWWVIHAIVSSKSRRIGVTR
ncbi:MAG TPA: hypothetical protein VLI04_07770 [Nocardioidaceae bacterium]|nr:hypothetical protein [Nocardioidaceae bacterium]